MRSFAFAARDTINRFPGCCGVIQRNQQCIKTFPINISHIITAAVKRFLFSSFLHMYNLRVICIQYPAGPLQQRYRRTCTKNKWTMREGERQPEKPLAQSHIEEVVGRRSPLFFFALMSKRDPLFFFLLLPPRHHAP